MARYRIEMYAPDGSPGAEDYQGVAHADTLREARQEASRLLGGRKHGPRWYPDEDNAVEGWHESREDGCGGAIIYEEYS